MREGLLKIFYRTLGWKTDVLYMDYIRTALYNNLCSILSTNSFGLFFMPSHIDRFLTRSNYTKNKKSSRILNSTNDQKQKKKLLCIIRESNTGLVDGNDEFYH